MITTHTPTHTSHTPVDTRCTPTVAVDSIVNNMPEADLVDDRSITNGSDAYLTPAALRQPAEALGPRAQKTIARILDATRDVFLSRGYSGTTIDEIARVAEVSRASFYTYFPTKREVLLAVGAHTASGSMVEIAKLEGQGPGRAEMIEWVDGHFHFLDIHGSFSFAWPEAAQQDAEILEAGMKRHLSICRSFGRLLAATAGRTVANPAELGVVASALLERTWHYGKLYGDRVDRSLLVTQAGHALWGLARQPESKPASP